MNWFDVDKQGLAKLVDQRGKAFVLHELLANAWDTKTGMVAVKLEKLPNSPKAIIEVLDEDPNGFKNLTHAWTLFAESDKKSDTSKRGRFNLGEKLVLAVCYDAEISTTSGTVVFNDTGRHSKKVKRHRGSLFRGTVRMNQQEFDEACQSVLRLIPPVRTEFNGEALPDRAPIHVFKATLPTVIADEQGFLRKSERMTDVELHLPFPGEVPCIYEMGIPIVETGDKWHVNVMQKVPLNMDRDGVTPAYLRAIRTLVVNEMRDSLSAEDANATFVNEALSDPAVAPETVKKTLDLKYGEKRAVFDPSDTEANMNLVAKGYTLIHGAQLNAKQWENVRKHDTVKPSGQIAPTKMAHFGGPDAKDVWVPKEKWSNGMHWVVGYSRALGQRLLGYKISVNILSDITLGYSACFGDMGLVFNFGRLGKDFFEQHSLDRLNQLLIHEFGHAIEPNHLSDKYHEALCMLGAKMVKLALESPGFFLGDFGENDFT